MAAPTALLRPRLKKQPQVGKMEFLPNGFVEATRWGEDGEVMLIDGKYVILIKRRLNNATNVMKVRRAFGLDNMDVEVREK